MSIDNNKRILFPWVILTLTNILLLIGLFFVFTPIDSGFVLFDDNNKNDVRYVLKLFIESLSKFTDFIVGSFAAIAFLVTYQVKVGAVISSRAWVLLTTGIVMLTGALIFCFLGQEQLLIMSARNSIDFTLPALKFGRWCSYVCMSTAAVLIGFYAIEVATAAKVPVPENSL